VVNRWVKVLPGLVRRAPGVSRRGAVWERHRARHL